MKSWKNLGFVIMFSPLCLCGIAYSQAKQSPAKPATSTTVARARNAAAGLVRYQLALDQISSGHFTEARVLIEEGIRLYGNQPELTLLLGYLLEREGRTAEARQRLAQMSKNSPLAAAYVAALSKQAARAPGASTSRGEDLGDAGAVVSTPVRLAQTNARLARLEQVMAQLVNNERASAGLNPLTSDAQLASTARAHSADMRDRKYFAHQSPTAALREPLDRYRAVFGTTPMVIAENVYRSWFTGRHQLSEADVKSGHAGLMKSPGHRANILRSNVTRIGIGIVTNANGDIWITQMFARP